MYEAYWGLKESPFENSPNPKFFYLSPEHEEALIRMVYAVKQRKGAAMLTGEYGCGKTTLTRALLQRLEGERYDVGLLTNPSLGQVDFIREILYQLGVDGDGRGKADLLHQLNELVLRNLNAGKDTVIIIDEAQLIEDTAIFEELRLLLNFQLDDRFLLTLLLVGQPELREKIQRLKQLDQRIAIRYHLNTLDYAHTMNYIAHRLRTAGLARSIFTEGAVKVIYDFTRGTPREINNICDICLLVGFSKRVTEIDEKIVTEVIHDTVGVS